MSPAPLYHVTTEALEQRLIDLAGARARLDVEIAHVTARLADRGVTPRPMAPLELPSVDELLTRAADLEANRDGMRP